MTKQEQIEDMAKAACAACGRDGYHCPLLAKYRPCDASLKYAEAVYNAGYRKAEGVRKETANMRKYGVKKKNEQDTSNDTACG